jgi:hypothetical protein
MASQPSPPTSSARPRRARREHPRLRGFIWTVAALCGGLVLVLLFFATIGVIDFSEAPALGIVALVMTVFWIGTMVILARLGTSNASRARDRERRGF